MVQFNPVNLWPLSLKFDFWLDFEQRLLFDEALVFIVYLFSILESLVIYTKSTTCAIINTLLLYSWFVLQTHIDLFYIFWSLNNWPYDWLSPLFVTEFFFKLLKVAIKNRRLDFSVFWLFNYFHLVIVCGNVFKSLVEKFRTFDHIIVRGHKLKRDFQIWVRIISRIFLIKLCH